MKLKLEGKGETGLPNPPHCVCEKVMGDWVSDITQ